MTQTPTTELLSVVRAMRDYIDTLPSDVVASLPTMPGFDRDWADEAIEAANREAQPVASREHFESLCNQFWNWDEFDEINAEEEPRLQWDGKNYTHRVTAALWRMYQSSPPAPAPAVPEEINPDSPIIIGILPDSDWTRREKCIAADMWNACRAAMLAQPVSQGYKLNSPEIPDGCQWTYDEHDYKWDSACGEAWMFSDGGPIENGVKFCQSCGKPVLLAAAPEGGNG